MSTDISPEGIDFRLFDSGFWVLLTFSVRCIVYVDLSMYMDVRKIAWSFCFHDHVLLWHSVYRLKDSSFECWNFYWPASCTDWLHLSVFLNGHSFDLKDDAFSLIVPLVYHQLHSSLHVNVNLLSQSSFCCAHTACHCPWPPPLILFWQTEYFVE